MGRSDADDGSTTAVVGRALSVVSHLAYLPTVAALIYRRRFGDALLFLYLTVASTFYHVLDVHWTDEVVGRDFDFWAATDLLVSLWGFIAVSDHLIAYRTPMRRHQYLIAMLSTAVFWWAVVPRSVSDIAQVVLVLGVAGVYLGKRIVDRRPVRIPMRMLYTAYALGLTAALLQGIASVGDDRNVYYYTHSMWHVGTGLASLAVFWPRVTIQDCKKVDGDDDAAERGVRSPRAPAVPSPLRSQPPSPGPHGQYAPDPMQAQYQKYAQQQQQQQQQYQQQYSAYALATPMGGLGGAPDYAYGRMFAQHAPPGIRFDNA
jgi:hypothetical protein